MSNNCWIPNEITFEGDYNTFVDRLLKIFRTDFHQSKLYFLGKHVATRTYPKHGDWEEAFFHLTHKEDNTTQQRLPDLERSQKLLWIRQFIEHYGDCVKCLSCSGVKMWHEPYKATERYFLFSEEKKYVVILEERATFFLLITAYCLQNKHALNNMKQHSLKFSCS